MDQINESYFLKVTGPALHVPLNEHKHGNRSKHGDRQRQNIEMDMNMEWNMKIN